MEFLMDKNKRLVTEKDEFESWRKSRLKALFGTVTLSGVLCKEQKPQVSSHSFHHKEKFSITALSDEFEPVTSEQKEFEN